MKRIVLSLILVFSVSIGVMAQESYSSYRYVQSLLLEFPNEQAKIGYFYYTGTGGFVQDYNQAYQWFKKAADKGNSYAQYYLGLCYKNGHGVKKNRSIAFDWFKKSADQNYVDAMYEVGYAYEHGEVVSKNMLSAADYYYLPALCDYMDATYRLGCIYYKGYARPKHVYDNAQYFLEKALEKMDPQADAKRIAEAKKMLGDIYCQEGNKFYHSGNSSEYVRAYLNYQEGADTYGNYEAHYGWGNCCFYGRGTKKNIPEAINHYTLAASHGVVDAQYALGLCYKNGTGVPVDEYTAYQWLLKAAQGGKVDAFYEVGSKQEELMLLDEAAQWYLALIDKGNKAQKAQAEQRLEVLASLDVKAAKEYINSASVVVKGYFSDEAIYILDPATNEYNFCGTGTWEATDFPVGTYTIKRTYDRWEDQYETIVIKHPSTTYSFGKMQPKEGTLSVQSTPDKADLYLNDIPIGKTPWEGNLQVGDYLVQLKKEGRVPSEVYTVTVPYQQKVTTRVQLKNEAVYGADTHPDHYLEPTYGLDLTQLNKLKHYVGLRYGWIPKRFGLEVATLYGINNQELSATIGPSFRLTKFSSPLSLQFSLGAGAMHRFTDNHTTWVLDAGLRFGFEDKMEADEFAWWSFTLGTRYYDQRFIPTVSVSLMPVRAFSMLAQIEEDIPCIFTEVQTGYEFGSKQWMMGGHIDYISTHLGVGTSFMVGFKGGWDVTAGPLFRLTTDAEDVDLQVYQGFGYGSWGLNKGFVAESGIRFAFDGDLTYWEMWNFSIGCIYDGKGTVAATIGVSLPIVSIIGTAGIAAPFYFW